MASLSDIVGSSSSYQIITAGIAHVSRLNTTQLFILQHPNDFTKKITTTFSHYTTQLNLLDNSTQLTSQRDSCNYCYINNKNLMYLEIVCSFSKKFLILPVFFSIFIQHDIIFFLWGTLKPFLSCLHVHFMSWSRTVNHFKKWNKIEFLVGTTRVTYENYSLYGARTGPDGKAGQFPQNTAVLARKFQSQRKMKKTWGNPCTYLRSKDMR